MTDSAERMSPSLPIPAVLKRDMLSWYNWYLLNVKQPKRKQSKLPPRQRHKSAHMQASRQTLRLLSLTHFPKYNLYIQYLTAERLSLPHVGLLVNGPMLECDPMCLWMARVLHEDRISI